MSDKKKVMVREAPLFERYLVIENRRSAGFFKRFVISDGDEKARREPMAATRIIGIGFGVREEASAIIPRSSSTRKLRCTVGLPQAGRIAFATLQHVVLASFLLFHSRSIVGSVIRAVVCT
jgi:hypothetical protein